MYSTKTSVGIHILCVIALSPDASVTSDRIAGSIGTNPALVRRLMSGLKKAGLIRTSTKLGVVGLGKDTAAITLLDVFQAVEQQQRVFDLHTDTNPNCPVGANIQRTLTCIYQQVQTDFETRLGGITLADILDSLQQGIGAKQTYCPSTPTP